MTQTDFLKIAYLKGLVKAADEFDLPGEERDALAKYALDPGRMWSKVKGVFQRGAKEAPGAAATTEAAGGQVARTPGYSRGMRGTPAAPVAAPTTGAPQMPTRPTYGGLGEGPAAAKAAPAPAAKPAPTTSAPQMSQRMEGEGFWQHRKRLREFKGTQKIEGATPRLVTKQKSRTAKEIDRGQRADLKKTQQAEAQEAFKTQQQARQDALTRQEAAVAAEKAPAAKAAPKAAPAPKGEPLAAGGATRTEATTEKAVQKADEGAVAAKETGAKAEENLAQRYEESRAAMPGMEGGPEAQKQLAEVAQQGATGGLGFMPATLAPAALGAGVGYAADGREGALMGAGLGLGARAGMGPLLKRLREARGFKQMLGGSAGAAPSMSEYLATPMGRKSLLGAGLMGAGGAGLGYAAGDAMPSQEPEPWYGGLGVSPQMAQGVGQTAIPYLAQQYGLDPAMLQSLGAQYGLAPPQMNAGMY